jgi:hypothetical protein
LEVDFGNDSLNPTWTNNLVFGNTTDYQLIASQTGTNGNISVDPMFVSNSDLHLRFGSPAINVGSSLNAPNHDFDGNFRPTGGGFDLGAYEFVPEPSSIILAGAGFIGLAWLLLQRHSAHTRRSPLYQRGAGQRRERQQPPKHDRKSSWMW